MNQPYQSQIYNNNVTTRCKKTGMKRGTCSFLTDLLKTNIMGTPKCIVTLKSVERNRLA